MMDFQTFADMLNDARERRDMSIQQLCDELRRRGFQKGYGTVRKWCAGDGFPHDEDRRLLWQFLGFGVLERTLANDLIAQDAERRAALKTA